MSPPRNTSSPAELLEQLKSQLAAALFTAISDQLTHFQNTVVAYENKLQYAELKIQVLEERLRRKLIEKYGPGSEASRGTTGAVGTGAGSQQRRSAGGKRTRAARTADAEAPPAPAPTAAGAGAAAGGAGDFLHG